MSQLWKPTPKQIELIKFYNNMKPKMLMCDGPIRSSKTMGLIPIFLGNISENYNMKYDYIITGRTMSSIERNVLRPLKDYWSIDARLDKYSKFHCLGNYVNCFGGDNSKSWENIPGFTAYGYYSNETTLTHENTIKAAIGRCSGEGSKIIFDTNPSSPNSFAYQNYINPVLKSGNTQKLSRFPFQLSDNYKINGGYLGQDYVDMVNTTFKGIWYKKYIQGLWVAVEGQIYFEEKLNYYDEKILDDKSFWDHTSIIGYCDPAMGKSDKACFAPILTALKKDDNIYIINTFLKRSLGIKMVDEISNNLKQFDYTQFIIENNFAQDEYIVEPVRKLNPHSPVIGRSNMKNKLERIIGMEDIIYTKVFFPESYKNDIGSDGWLLLQQLCNINAKEINTKPNEDYEFVDGPDALEGLVNTCKKIGNMQKESIKAGGKKFKRNW